MSDSESKREDNGKSGNEDLGPLVRLARLPRDAFLSAEDLRNVLGCCTKTVSRAVDRGDFPPALTIRGKRHWSAGSIRDHLVKKEKMAIAQERRRNQNPSRRQRDTRRQ